MFENIDAKFLLTSTNAAYFFCCLYLNLKFKLKIVFSLWILKGDDLVIILPITQQGRMENFINKLSN